MKLFTGTFINNQPTLDPEEQHHILKVLRLKDNDSIYVTDGRGKLAKANLQILGSKISLYNIIIQEVPPVSTPHIHIAIAPTKNLDRIEFFLEKAVEMRVASLTLIQTQRTERKNINEDKLYKQIITACKQSLRIFFPEFGGFQKLEHFLQRIQPNSTFVAHCESSLQRSSLNEVNLISSPTVLIGPEGDFNSKEINQMAEIGIRGLSLGESRLRTETAGLMLAAWNYSRKI